MQHLLAHLFGLVLLALGGLVVVLGVAGVVLRLVGWVTRLSRQINRPARASWQFSDLGQPPPSLPAPDDARDGIGGRHR